MTTKELFTLLETSNKLAEMLGDKKQYISLRDDIFNIRDKEDNTRFYSLKEFRKALNYNYRKELVTEILSLQFEQEESYKNYFEYEGYEIGIFQD